MRELHPKVRYLLMELELYRVRLAKGKGAWSYSLDLPTSKCTPEERLPQTSFPEVVGAGRIIARPTARRGVVAKTSAPL